MVEEHAHPNPDKLLARTRAEEAQEKRGKPKISLGYAPGVGRTYAMLEAAHLHRKDTDVAVACVEMHGRAETQALMEGREIILRRQAKHP
jgi:two-component system sensor histidine kinase KdpD